MWGIMEANSSKLNCDGRRCGDLSQFAITMAFQPQIDVVERRIYGYEALVRGLNGETAATVLSRVTADTVYAFDQACRVKAIELAAKLGIRENLSINFMPNAVYHPASCLRKTIESANAFGFPIERITFEFTEDEYVVDRDHMKSIIQTYHKQGFKTAIDDFGSGYAGLGLLVDLQTDILKVDQTIIRGISVGCPRWAVMLGIITMADKLGIDILCEGVETIEEYGVLRSMGVRYMQGFLFAKPMIEMALPRQEIYWPE